MLSTKISAADSAVFEGVKIGNDGSMEPLEDSEKLGENKTKKREMKTLQVCDTLLLYVHYFEIMVHQFFLIFFFFYITI